MFPASSSTLWRPHLFKPHSRSFWIEELLLLRSLGHVLAPACTPHEYKSGRASGDYEEYMHPPSKCFILGLVYWEKEYLPKVKQGVSYTTDREHAQPKPL